MATLDPGDDLLAAPYWTSYADIVRVAGGKAVSVICRDAERMSGSKLIISRTRDHAAHALAAAECALKPDRGCLQGS